jgi:DNA-binding response OmpR family regulator
LLFPLAESQAGSLTVEVQPGAAIEITFSLPASQPASAPAENTVLIVDDDPDGAFLLEQVLLKAGFQVLIARNGLEGLSLARRKGVTVILLDVMLPGLDGFEVCHRLREDAVTAKKPIVMISAKGRPEDRQMGLRVGADDYMTKPLGMNEVVQTVTRFMKSNEEGSDD